MAGVLSIGALWVCASACAPLNGSSHPPHVGDAMTPERHAVSVVCAEAPGIAVAGGIQPSSPPKMKAWAEAYIDWKK
jgi:hypothetical protein